MLNKGGKNKEMNQFEIMMNPEKYGFMQCKHCNGYGSSLKDPEGVNTCTKCGGSGLVKSLKEELSDDKNGRDIL
jgi:DnaJ-class molecular chaperone